MNIKDRLQIELNKNYTPILHDALVTIEALTEDREALQDLYNALEGHDLPLDAEELGEALAKLKGEAAATGDELAECKKDYMALADRFDNVSDIADKYAEISHNAIYGAR